MSDSHCGPRSHFLRSAELFQAFSNPAFYSNPRKQIGNIGAIVLIRPVVILKSQVRTEKRSSFNIAGQKCCLQCQVTTKKKRFHFPVNI